MSQDAGPDVTVDTAAADSSDTGAPTDSGDSETSQCNPIHVLGPPAVDGPSGQDISFVLAFETVNFGVDAPGSPTNFGFDLDGECTSCDDQHSSCVRPSYAVPVCDGPRGQDNATGLLFKGFSYIDNFNVKHLQEGVQKGHWGLLFRISDYNGTKNDKQVRVDWYVPAHFDESDADGGTGAVPKWDGTDVWPIRSTCLTKTSGKPYDVMMPLYFDDHAYVNDGKLVGAVDDGTLRLTDDLVLHFVGGVFQGDLVKEGELWHMNNARVAGRWPLDKILESLGQLDDPLLGNPLCTDNISYDKIKEQFCSHADIVSKPGSPGLPCDSLSITLGSKAIQAKLGPVVEYKPVPRKCPKETDPAYDSCAP